MDDIAVIEKVNGKNKIDYNIKQGNTNDHIQGHYKWIGEDGTVMTAGKSGKIPPGILKKYSDLPNDSIDNGNVDKYERNQYFFHPDHLGSTSFITDASGEVSQHTEYLPFGEILVDDRPANDKNPYLYNGKELDEETGLYYYGARYLDAQLGRFLNVDPISEDFYWVSPYNYAENEPIANIDLWGLQKFKVTDGRLISPYHALSFEVEGGYIENYYGMIKEFSTSKGNKFEVYYPMFYKTKDGNSPLFSFGQTLPKDDGLRNNCFGSAFGTKGNILSDVSIILKDNYTKTKRPKVGSVGVLEIGDDGVVGHAFEAIGKDKNGELLFRSDWLGGPEVTGTIKEVSEQILNYTGKGFITNKATGKKEEIDYKEYSKWTNEKKQQYTPNDEYQIKDFQWYDPNN